MKIKNQEVLYFIFLFFREAKEIALKQNEITTFRTHEERIRSVDPLQNIVFSCDASVNYHILLSITDGVDQKTQKLIIKHK